MDSDTITALTDAISALVGQLVYGLFEKGEWECRRIIFLPFILVQIGKGFNCEQIGWLEQLYIKLVDKDQTITQLRAEVSSAKYERSTLEFKLGKCQEDKEEARSRNKTLSMEISTLKTALTECKEELRRSLEDVKDTKENMTKKEIELRRSLESNFVSQNISTSHNLLTAFRSLSSQITTIQKTHLSVEKVKIVHAGQNRRSSSQLYGDDDIDDDDHGNE